MLRSELKGYNTYKLILNTYVSDFENANYRGTNERMFGQSNPYLPINRNNGLPYNERNRNISTKKLYANYCCIVRSRNL